jgi:N-methylhydantoinase A
MSSLPTEQNALRIGVDVGGTFTDLVCFDPDSSDLRIVKLPSTPPDFHRAVIDAVTSVASPGRPATIVHGSTVATNALLQRAGEPCAFVTTEGFRDMLLIGRQNRPHLYALHVQRPQPLTPESNWFTLRERIGAHGEVVEPLRDDEVDRLIAQIRERGLRHVAVCLLFSFVNPAHEQLIARRCAGARLTVSLSSDILPEFREYERASTTVINASLRPTVERYLSQLGEGLSGSRLPRDTAFPFGSEPEAQPQGRRQPVQTAFGAGTTSVVGNHQHGLQTRVAGMPATFDLRIMHSGGGTLSVEQAQVSAARLVLSGPAGGVIGAAFVARAAGLRDVITYDMGGTSTDVATIIGAQPQWTTSSTIDGLPLGLATLDIHTVGAGGGSVAYLDVGGALRVGPRSAGAIPGPACYDRGGTEPTVTDANLLLGRILPDRFAGGSMHVKPELALRAIQPLARAMGKSVIATALGIVRVAEDNMAHAVRAVSSRRGLDPRQFTLLSFGGAGGLHACAIADSLEIPSVLVPPYCGVLSALGMVVAPPVADASRTVVHLGDALDDARLAAEFGALSGQTMDVIPYDQTASVEAWADVRFNGQSHELTVRVERPASSHVADQFATAYRARYGQVPENRPVEIVTLRVRRFGRVPELKLPKITPDGGATESRASYPLSPRERVGVRAEGEAPPISPHPSPLPEGAGEKLVPVKRSISQQGRLIDSTGCESAARAVTRPTLLAAGPTSGPLLLIDPEATTFVPTGWTAAASENGSVFIERTGVS